MKKLYLLRHGKSSWNYNELSDFERPLNERGRRDVPFMAKLLLNLGIKPDLIISSPALRAYFTVRTVAGIIDYPLEKIQTSELVYEAGISELMQLVSEVDDRNESILIAGHNPGFTAFCNTLSDKYLDNIPTSGFVYIELNIDKWSEIKPECGTLKLFEYPKKYSQ